MRGSRRRDGERGQVLVLFILGLVAMLAVGALLLDGANALVTRRRLQNAGDAAALAGANTIHAAGSAHVCSTVSSSPPGAARADIIAAVNASLAVNVPWLQAGNITVTCAQEAIYKNQAVSVDLRINSSNFLGAAIGYGGTVVATSSTALNGQIAGSDFNIVLLDPWNSGWPNNKRGCPSFLISGGPTMHFGGSVQINSACPAANGGALGTNGSSATVTFSGGRSLYMVGGYDPGPLTINPTPVTGAGSLEDPLQDLEPITSSCTSGTIRSATRLVLNGVTQVLEPGVYCGGIELRSSAIALLRPGIYIIDGGGISVGAQASLCSISATSIATNCTAFASECPDIACGALLYNTGTASTMGQLSVGAGSTVKLRAYDDRANANVGFEYRNILIWQSASPVPTATYAQPEVRLNGGGNIDISGTVYAPSAKVAMGGGSGGSGGSITLSLQFIAWDLEMSGNSAFAFNYNDADFAFPKDYGLVK
ncbi:MAG: pilus assembly protein TadG-related protein [Thermoleophilaceae bacterium]